MNTRTFKLISYANIALVATCFLSILFFIVVSSNYVLTMSSDDWVNAFRGKSAIDYMLHNYYNWNGRWGQGLSNDFRFYEYRTLTTLIFNSFFLFSVFFLFRKVYSINNTIFLAFLFYLTYLYSIQDFYQAIFYFPSALSYTFGSAIFMIIIGLTFKIHQDRNYITIIILTIIVCGLIESFSLVSAFFFFILFLYHFVKDKKISWKLLSLLLISIVSFLIIYFSPGNLIRREKYDKGTSDFNFELVLKILNEFFSSNINFVLLILVLALLITPFKSDLSKLFFDKFKYQKVFLILGFSFIFLIPLALGTFTITYKSVYRLANTSTIFFLLSVSLLVIFYFVRYTTELLPKKRVELIKMGLIIVSILFIIKTDNNVSKLINQIINEDLVNWYDEESSRREYLTTTFTGNKREIPPYSKNYNNKIHTFNNNISNSKVYWTFFNQKNKISINKKLPDIRILNLIEKVKSFNIEALIIDEDFTLYNRGNFVLAKLINIDRNSFLSKITLTSSNSQKKTIDNYKTYFDVEENILVIKIEDTSFSKIEINNKAYFIEEAVSFDFYRKEKDPLKVIENNKLMKKNIEESNKTKSHNKNTLLVSFNINIKKADEIQLFYLDHNNKQYNANKSIVKNVKPTENNSAINFEINTSFGFPTNLRFDYGSVKDQQVVINNITFKKGNREFTIDQSEVHKYFNSPKEWNINVDLKNAVYGSKKNKDRFDSKLIGNNKLRVKLKTFQ